MFSKDRRIKYAAGGVLAGRHHRDDGAGCRHPPRAATPQPHASAVTEATSTSSKMKERAAETFAAADTNGDGKITRGRVPARTSRKQAGERRRPRHGRDMGMGMGMGMGHHGRDGRYRRRKQREAFQAELFKALDTDHNGQLSAAEFSKAWETRTGRDDEEADVHEARQEWRRRADEGRVPAVRCEDVGDGHERRRHGDARRNEGRARSARMRKRLRRRRIETRRLPNPTDEELMARVQRRDQEAFTRLLDRHLAGLQKFLIRMTGNAADADEVAQEAFLRIWSHAQQLAARSRQVHDVVVSNRTQSGDRPSPQTVARRMTHDVATDRRRRARRGPRTIDAERRRRLMRTQSRSYPNGSVPRSCCATSTECPIRTRRQCWRSRWMRSNRCCRVPAER